MVAGLFLTDGLTFGFFVTQTCLYAAAVLLTAFRLWIRSGRFWWEDWLALAGAAFAVPCALSMWMTITLIPEFITIFIWTEVITSTAVLWLSRLSIMFSLLRAIANPRMRCIIRLNLVLFGLAWVVTFALKIRVCAQGSAYGTMKTENVCPLSDMISTLEIIGDVVAAIILAVTPIVMLWDVKLARRPKALILCIFSANILSAVSGIVHAVTLVPRTATSVITGHLQLAIDMAMCNLLVIGTYVFRVIFKNVDWDGTTSDLETSSKPPSRLTTVDLDHFSSLAHTGSGSPCSVDDYVPETTIMA